MLESSIFDESMRIDTRLIPQVKNTYNAMSFDWNGQLEPALEAVLDMTGDRKAVVLLWA